MPEESGDPMVPIDRTALKKLVEAKTPFSMGEFEHIVGWDFVRDAPLSKKNTAWKLINMPRHQQQSILDIYRRFPECYIGRVGEPEAA